ncbi:MAG: alpha/beta fold hydrolase [SAR202 cluster bacterium]|nr:alpha/beta fold hydrolase [SAR202 cluster bacterium]
MVHFGEEPIPNVLARRRYRIAILVVTVVVVLYGSVSFLIAQGVTNASRKPQEQIPSDFNLVSEDVEFFSRRGDVKLSGWYLPGDDSGPHLIFVHGIGSVRSGDKAVGLAARIVGLGYNVLMFDLRGHGSSGGDKVSGGFYERADVLGAFDYLLRRGVDIGRVGLMGFSMGAATSIMAAAQEPRITALAADSTYANASELIAREAARKTPIPGWLTPVFMPASKLIANGIYGIDIGSLVPEESVAGLGYPVLVIHGTGDKRIPLEQGQRVAGAAKEGSSIWLVPEVDHLDAFLTHPDEYTERVDEYFSSRFR